MIFPIPEPMIAIKSIERSIRGKVSITSITLIIKLSIHPEKKPLTKPNRMPPTAAIATEKTPISKEVLAP